jgi:hypothetical protein
MVRQIHGEQFVWLRWVVVNNSHCQLSLRLPCHLIVFEKRNAGSPPPKYSREVAGCKPYFKFGDLLCACQSALIVEGIFERLV